MGVYLDRKAELVGVSNGPEVLQGLAPALVMHIWCAKHAALRFSAAALACIFALGWTETA